MNYATNLNDIPYNSKLFGSFKTCSINSYINRFKEDIKNIDRLSNEIEFFISFATSSNETLWYFIFKLATVIDEYTGINLINETVYKDNVGRIKF